MRKFRLFILLCLMGLPLMGFAQSSFTIVLDGNTSTVEGELMTADEVEYISTDTKHYQITQKNSALLGDVRTNGEIDVNDVTAIINMVLNGSSSVLADVTENGVTDVSDVTKTISIVLGEIEAKSVVVSYDVNDVTDVWIKGGQDDGPVEQN